MSGNADAVLRFRINEDSGAPPSADTLPAAAAAATAAAASAVDITESLVVAAAVGPPISRTRQSVLDDTTLTMEEIVQELAALTQRHVVLPDAVYAEMVRVLEAKDITHKQYNVWSKRQRFLVRSDFPALLFRLVPDGKVIKVDSNASSDEEEESSSAAKATTAGQFTEKRVIKQSELLPTIRSRHEDSKHAGYHATYNLILRSYANVPRDVVRAFCKRCLICIQKSKRVTVHPTKAIASSQFNERGQVDLFDMQTTPGGEQKQMKYVLHYQDHFTKISVLRPLATKEAANVAHELISIFCFSGPPRILQSDNGKEFTAAVILAICQQWNVSIINGRPYHPQSQGSVERANRVAKQKLAATMALRPAGADWVPELQQVQFEMNQEVKASHGRTPYELVFGIKPRTHTVAGSDSLSAPQRASLQELLPAEAMDESPEAVESAVQVREETVVAAAAAAAAYRENMIAVGAAGRLAHQFAAGDFVSFRLPKILSALDQPRVLCLITKQTRAGSYMLYCEHGMILPSQPAEMLDLVPRSEIPAGLDWNAADLLAEHAHQPRVIEVRKLIEALTKQTTKRTTATTAQLKAIADKQKKAQNALQPSTPNCLLTLI